MGRKSLALERREEILDAFARCILKYGLEGSTLERIAEEAGMKRSILRHYLGNRDELVESLIERISTSYRQDSSHAFAGVDQTNLIPALLDYLLAVAPHDDANERLITALLAAKELSPGARETLAAMFESWVDSISMTLHLALPGAEAVGCRQAAYMLLCLSVGHDTMMQVNPNPAYQTLIRTSIEAILDQFPRGL
jgi:AcrR family transcriptional regulator